MIQRPDIERMSSSTYSANDPVMSKDFIMCLCHIRSIERVFRDKHEQLHKEMQSSCGSTAEARHFVSSRMDMLHEMAHEFGIDLERIVIPVQLNNDLNESETSSGSKDIKDWENTHNDPRDAT